MTEAEFLEALRALPLAPGARGLLDDAATLGNLVVTKDLIAEGVHFRAEDPPGDVAWKLVAVNLSDLAAKGAAPQGVLLGYPLSDEAWDRAFLAGLGEALAAFACPLLGGDTIALPPAAPRMLSLTAIGSAAHAPARSGALAGDALWVTGTIGGAGAGLAGDPRFEERYRRPVPRLAEGMALAPHVHAMMDVSDGLLLDAARMADASGLAVTVDLAHVPLPEGYAGAPLEAATAGDDYELLFAAAPYFMPSVAATRIGGFGEGSGLTLLDAGDPVPLPARPGYSHTA